MPHNGSVELPPRGERQAVVLLRNANLVGAEPWPAVPVPRLLLPLLGNVMEALAEPLISIIVGPCPVPAHFQAREPIRHLPGSCLDSWLLETAAGIAREATSGSGNVNH